MKKVAILQSNYIPWKGYFDMIAAVDEFIIYDDMQYTKNDWRNRNKIKTPSGLQWITIPAGNNIHRKIKDVEIPATWQIKHWRTLESNYGKAEFFKEVSEWLKPFYFDRKETNLSNTNVNLIREICERIGIKTKITSSIEYLLINGKSERLVDLCIKAGATEYVSGPAAKDYIDGKLFSEAGIALTWFDYAGYREYQQLWGEFTHGVSIVDLLFNCGPNSRDYLRY